MFCIVEESKISKTAINISSLSIKYIIIYYISRYNGKVYEFGASYKSDVLLPAVLSATTTRWREETATAETIESMGFVSNSNFLFHLPGMQLDYKFLKHNLVVFNNETCASWIIETWLVNNYNSPTIQNI